MRCLSVCLSVCLFVCVSVRFGLFWFGMVWFGVGWCGKQPQTPYFFPFFHLYGPKIHVFRIFWPLHGVEITRKCRFWTRSVP